MPHHLDGAGRELRVHHLGGALAHRALDAHHEFVAQRLCGAVRVRVGVGLEDHLGDALPVAQIGEHHAAVIAHAVHPASEHHVAPLVARAQLAEVVRAIRRGFDGQRHGDGADGQGRGGVAHAGILCGGAVERRRLSRLGQRCESTALASSNRPEKKGAIMASRCHCVIAPEARRGRAANPLPHRCPCP